jgi:hypothetical protein
MEKIHDRCMDVWERFPHEPKPRLEATVERKAQLAKVKLSAAVVSDFVSALGAVKNREPLLAVNQEPDVTVAKVVRWKNVFLRMAQQVFAISGGFPYQEAADWEAAGDAVQEVASPPGVPDEFALDFWHRENALLTQVP